MQIRYNNHNPCWFKNHWGNLYRKIL